MNTFQVLKTYCLSCVHVFVKTFTELFRTCAQDINRNILVTNFGISRLNHNVFATVGYFNCFDHQKFPEDTPPDSQFEGTTPAAAMAAKPVVTGVFTPLDHSQGSEKEETPTNGSKKTKRLGKGKEIVLTAAEKEMLDWALTGFPPTGAPGLVPRAGVCGQSREAFLAQRLYLAKQLL